MALTWDDKTKLIASGEGGSPGQPYVPPKEDPKNPWVSAPGRGKLQAGIDLGGGRTLEAAEIRLLREIWPGASERERDKLIKMYGSRWLQSDATASSKS